MKKSKELERVLTEALIIARRYGHLYIGTKHVFLAMLTTASRVKPLVESATTNILQIQGAIERSLDEERSTIATTTDTARLTPLMGGLMKSAKARVQKLRTASSITSIDVLRAMLENQYPPLRDMFKDLLPAEFKLPE